MGHRFFGAIALLMLMVLTGCGGSGGSTSNQNPVVTSVTANPVSLAPGASSTITVVASDPNNDSLTYTYAATNGTVSSSGATATFLAGNAGTASVSVTVSDGRGGTANGSTNISIVQAAPEIRVTSLEVPSDTPGLSCLQFAAIPQEDVTLNSVRITNPRNDSITYNLGGTLIVGGQAINLQGDLDCYTKFSGPFKFVFTGVRPGSSAFTSEATYNQP
jgi:Bacterial Ig domain